MAHAMESCDLPAISEAGLRDDDVEACIRVLRAIEADRSHLTRLPREQRRELLTLAGLVAKPEKHDLVRMAKAFRRAEREAAKGARPSARRSSRTARPAARAGLCTVAARTAGTRAAGRAGAAA
jgi:hypothetical protein